MVAHIDLVLGNHFLQQDRQGDEVLTSMVAGDDEGRTVAEEHLTSSLECEKLISLYIQLDQVCFLPL